MNKKKKMYSRCPRAIHHENISSNDLENERFIGFSFFDDSLLYIFETSNDFT